MKHEEILERIQPIFHDVFDDEDLVILAEIVEIQEAMTFNLILLLSF